MHDMNTHPIFTIAFVFTLPPTPTPVPTLTPTPTAVKACGAAGRAEDALSLLDTIRTGGGGEGGGAVRPDVFCFNVCIGACVKGGLYERALDLLGEMRAEGVVPDVVR